MKKNFRLFLIFAVLLSIPAIILLLQKGFPLTDDGTWMIIRFSAFHQVLRAGEFPVRFLSRLNYGYGYPVADFLYPEFMYLAEVPKILGFGFVDSVKIVLDLSIIGSAVFVFLWLSKFFDNFESLIGSLIYVYAPYHLYDVYKRGSVGEVLALAVIPFIFWQIERRSFFWTTIGIGLLILAHNTLAFLFLFLILGYMLVDILKYPKEKLLYRYIFSLILGFGITSFFWIPALYDLRYTVFSKTPVSFFGNYFVGVNLIGYSVILIFLLSLMTIVGKKTGNKLAVLFMIFGLLSLFLSLSISKSVWEILPVTFIQFPFRFLSVTIICVSFLASFTLSALSKRNKYIFAVILLILIVFSTKQIMISVKSIDYGEGFYSTNVDTTTVQNEYMPKWVKIIPTSLSGAGVENLNGREKISDLTITPNKIAFDISLPGKRMIQINTIYFPGWTAYVNGVKTSIAYNNPRGLMILNLKSGQSNVLIVFKETFVRLIADCISLLSLAVVLFILSTIKRGANMNI